MRSCAASNESMNARVASRTIDHCDPIELETSSTIERSTMRRVAWLELAIVTWLKLASFMTVVGSTVDADTLTMLTPLTVSTLDEKKFGSVVGSVVVDVPM